MPDPPSDSSTDTPSDTHGDLPPEHLTLAPRDSPVARRPRPLSSAADNRDAGQGKPGKDEPKGFWARQWKGWIRPIGMTVLVVVLVRTWAVDWNDVPSGSMEARESVFTGDRVVVWKSAYDLRIPWPIPVFNDLRKLDFVRYGGPDRGDVVTFWNPQTQVRMIKRVVAIPGDTITMRRGELSIIDADGNDVPVGYQPLGTATTPPWRAGFHDYLETLGGEDHTIQREFPLGQFDQTRLARLGAIPGVGRLSVEDSRLMLDGQEVAIEVWRGALFRAYRFAAGLPTQTPDQRDQRSGLIGHLRALQLAQLRTNFGPITLKDYPGRDDADEYWAMGDNRDHSSDSRFFGVPMANVDAMPTVADDLEAGQLRITSRDITGKVFAIAWSLDEDWAPRWGRFFKGVD
jgi:signal peptidase I